MCFFLCLFSLVDFLWLYYFCLYMPAVMFTLKAYLSFACQVQTYSTYIKPLFMKKQTYEFLLLFSKSWDSTMIMENT